MSLNNDNNLLIKEKVKVKNLDMYAVIMLNDDYTPMEFVIYVLQSVFKKNYEDAKKIMLLFIMKEKVFVVFFPLDIAETKANQVVEFARINQHPLECSAKTIAMISEELEISIQNAFEMAKN